MRINISTDPRDSVIVVSKSSTVSLWCVNYLNHFKQFKISGYLWEKHTIHFIESLKKNAFINL
jgi:hypothetical protein